MDWRQKDRHRGRQNVRCRRREKDRLGGRLKTGKGETWEISTVYG